MFYIPPVREHGRLYIVCLMMLLLILSAGGMPVNAALKTEPLLLSLNPPSPGSGENCGHDPAPAAKPGRPGGESGRPSGESGRPSGESGSHAGHPGGQPGGRPGPVMESEHRPVPMRTYHLTDVRRIARVEAFVRRPDGSVIEPDLHLGVNPGLSFPTPKGDGPVHGANSVYVVEQGIEGDQLLVRTAKWITMHHSCGWGHDGKFDKTKTQPQPLNTIPFEIVITNLWDPNFHASVTSGDHMIVTVLSYGEPVSGARVTLSTEKGWSKQLVTNEKGIATLQLIRDYYTSSWPEFHRTHRGKFLVTAKYDADQKGSFKDKQYKRVSYITTLPWKYSPSSRDYSSYTFGLLVGILSLTVSGVGVYAYRERRKKPYKRISFDE